MNTQGTLAGYKTTEEFVSELQKHLKITKVCKNDDILSCFEDTVMFGAGEAEPEEVDMSTIKTSKHFGQKKWETNVVGLQLNNGTNALIAYNPECRQDPYSNQITGSGCVAVLYDTSGYAKPNTSGKDLRAINVTQLGSKCAFEIGETCYGAPFKPTPLTNAECEAQKGDLGIRECNYDNDYWAGAVAACGHVNKMPTIAQLTELTQYLYPSSISSIKPTGNTSCYSGLDLTPKKCRDTEKALSLGFTAEYGVFYIWSGVEEDASSAYQRAFWSTQTSGGSNYRRNSDRQAVCIAD